MESSLLSFRIFFHIPNVSFNKGVESLDAVIYIRQSSSNQVFHNVESGLRQRNFVERAIALGWSQDRILVIDEDLGETASRTGKRSGFDQMVAMAALGKIGIILVIEVSWLARANRDWYHLLNICAIMCFRDPQTRGDIHP